MPAKSPDFSLLITKRYWFASISILLLVWLVTNVNTISLNADSRIFFEKDNENLRALDVVDEVFTKVYSVNLILKFNRNIFNSENLNAIIDLTKRAWKIPSATRVNSLANYQYIKGTGDDLVIRDLLDKEIIADQKNIETILTNCIEEIKSGKATLAQCLDHYPSRRQELEPLLKMALIIKEPPTFNLDSSYKQSAKARLLQQIRTAKQN